MNIKEAKELLTGVFVDKAGSPGVLCFADEYMREQHEDKQNIYRAVSKAMQDSGLTFSFSYEIANKAVDILAESEDWEDEYALYEKVDSAIPIYNDELMQIYTENWYVVDEACEEMGEGSNGSVARAEVGWLVAISDMVQAIKSNIEDVCGE